MSQKISALRNPATNRSFGAWQQEVLETLASDPTNKPWNPLKSLRGSAKNWTSRYRSALVALEEAGLIAESVGPKGGRGYYVATEALVRAVA